MHVSLYIIGIYVYISIYIILYLINNVIYNIYIKAGIENTSLQPLQKIFHFVIVNNLHYPIG